MRKKHAFCWACSKFRMRLRGSHVSGVGLLRYRCACGATKIVRGTRGLIDRRGGLAHETAREVFA